MASLSYAQKISDIAKSLADPEISESARADILLSMTTLVSENARLKEDLVATSSLQKQLDESKVRETELRDVIARHESHRADLIETYQTKQRFLRAKIASLSAVETELSDVKAQLEIQTAAATGFRNEAIQLEATITDIREKAKSNTAKLMIAQQKVESHDQLLAAIETSRDAWMDDTRTLLAYIVCHRKSYEFKPDWLWNLPISEHILKSEETDADGKVSTKMPPGLSAKEKKRWSAARRRTT